MLWYGLWTVSYDYNVIPSDGLLIIYQEWNRNHNKIYRTGDKMTCHLSYFLFFDVLISFS